MNRSNQIKLNKEKFKFIQCNFTENNQVNTRLMENSKDIKKEKVQKTAYKIILTSDYVTMQLHLLSQS